MKKIINHIERPFFLIVLFFLFQFVSTVGKIDRYTLPSYFVSYSHGWGVRRFLGTVIETIFPNYVSGIGLWVFVSLFTFLLILLFSRFLSRVYHAACEDGTKISAIFLILLISVSPFSVAYLFPGANYGRMELYLLILVFSYIAIDGLWTNLWRKRLVMYVFMIMGCLVHQIFVFLCLPFFAMMALRDWYSTRDKRLIGFDLSFVVCLAVFVLFLQFGKQHFDMTQLAVLQSKTNIPLHSPAFELEYNSSFSDHLILCLMPNYKRMLIGFIFTIILMSPFIFIIAKFWNETLKTCKTVIDKYFIYAVIALNIPILCCFLFAMDYGRWFAQLFLYNFTVIIMMTVSSDKKIRQLVWGGVNSLQNDLMRRPLLYIVIIGYASSLQVFQASRFFPLIERLISLLGIVEVVQ